MLKKSLLAILVMSMMVPAIANADFYKYVDKNGNIVFTDDLSTIPKSQRENAEKYDEPPPSAQHIESSKEIQSNSNFEKIQPSAATKEDMNKKKEELEKKQAQLEQEYEALMKEKADLERQKSEAKGHKQIKDYNDRVLKFSEKLNQYNEKRIALEDDVTKYNDAVEKLNKQSEK